MNHMSKWHAASLLGRGFASALLTISTFSGSGTAEGNQPAEPALPALVADLAPGAAGSFPEDYVQVGSRVYFQACRNGVWNLYRIDGPDAAPIALQVEHSSDCEESFHEAPYELAAAGGGLVSLSQGSVLGDDGSGLYIFSLPPFSLPPSASPETLASTGELAAFFARAVQGPAQLWFSDGSQNTDQGTGPVAVIPGEPVPGFVVGLRGEIYFVVEGSQCCDGLWRSDLTAEGTHRVKETFDYDDVRSRFFAKANDLAFFFDGVPVAPELWVSDGSAEGTRSLGLQDRADILPRATEIVAMGDRLYFLAFDPIAGEMELWQSDGTAPGTGPVVGFPETAGEGSLSLGATLLAADDLLYFTLYPGPRFELWRSDGTAAGTRKVAVLPQGKGLPIEHELVVQGDRAYLQLADEEHGAELWQSDGTEAGTTLVADVMPGPESSLPKHLTPLGDRLFFTATGPEGREPWVLGGVPTCAESAHSVCLAGGRFRVEVQWSDFSGGSGAGRVGALRTDDTGSFWFFDRANLELLVKVLDARTINGHFWVFFGSLSNVEFTVSVTDTISGAVREYRNPAGLFASAGDINAFATSAEKAAPTAAVLHGTTTAPPAAPCEADAGDLCLQGGRFRVEVDWTDFAGMTCEASAVPVSGNSGAFWFFHPDNFELLVKVLDGRAINGRFWVFFGSTSNVPFTLTVTDTETGQRRTYENAAGVFASVGDTNAF